VQRERRRRFEQYRRETAGPVENTLIDDLLSGDMSRGEFIRRASVFGLSMGAVGTALGLAGEAAPAFAARRAVAAGVARLSLGITPAPAGPIEPYTLADTGALDTASINGEYLNRATSSLTVAPELALSWKPNHDASVWTYTLRPGVKFQNGQPLTADDVVATYARLTDPSGKSQALSAFSGILVPSGITKVDDLTVRFALETPTASFPYLTSDSTYQAIILPASYQVGTYATTPQTTGAFILASYNPGVGATYNRNPDWWGGVAPLAGVDATYFNEEPPLDAAVLGGQTQLASEITYLGGGRSLINNKDVQVFTGKGSAHREISMRTDVAPFNDPRVRRAIALTLNRPQTIKTLLGGLADLGNDSPFAPAFPSTVKSVAQRHQELAQARSLLAAAGHSKGLNLVLTTHQFAELPALAQVLQASAKEVGINIKLDVQTTQAYYSGTSTGGPDGYGTTPWLNTPFNITDWGHRAVPNLFLTASLVSKGVWNASRYNSKKFDSLTTSFIGAISLADQRKYADKIETQLLNDTPVIYPYFYYWLAAGAKGIKDYYADPLAAVYLSKTSLA
jgi:peptide/nickel transport system substrate-binding protein